MEDNNTTKTLRLYLGSYEGKVFSMGLDIKSKELNSFSFKVSENSLKTIITHGNYIFASGVDEIVHIYDMNTKEEKGMVMTYAGSVSHIEISKNYLFSCGDDSNIIMWRMSDFKNIHNLKGHKAGITHLVIHKSARFCLSASKDNSLIIWNLTTGVKIIKYNFKNDLVCKKILFVNKQQLAVLIFENEIWLFDLFKETERVDEYVVKRIKLADKIFDAFAFKNCLVVLHSLGEMKIFEDITTSDQYKQFALEKPETVGENELGIRVKLANLTKAKKFKLLNVIFSNNEIYIYDLNRILKSLGETEDNSTIKKFRNVNLKTSDRITCLDTILIN